MQVHISKVYVISVIGRVPGKYDQNIDLDITLGIVFIDLNILTCRFIQKKFIFCEHILKMALEFSKL